MSKPGQSRVRLHLLRLDAATRPTGLRSFEERVKAIFTSLRQLQPLASLGIADTQVRETLERLQQRLMGNDLLQLLEKGRPKSGSRSDRRGEDHAAFRLRLDDVLRELDALRLETKLAWGCFFHWRSVVMADSLSLADTILITKLLDNYISLSLHGSSSSSSSSSSDNSSGNCLATARSLLAYILQHSSDPDNCLLGLTPSISCVKKLGSATGEQLCFRSALLPSTSFSNRPAAGDLVLCFLSNDRQPSSFKPGSWRTGELAPSSSASQASGNPASTASATASPTRRLSAQSSSSLDLVRGSWSFGRIFTEPVESAPGLTVCFSSDEKELASIAYENVVPLNAELLKNLGYSTRSLTELVENPVEAFFTVIRRLVRDTIVDFLNANGVHMGVILHQPPSLRHLILLKFTSRFIELSLRQLDEPGPCPLIKSFIESLNEIVALQQMQFLSALSAHSVVSPLRAAMIEQLRTIDAYILTFVRATLLSDLSRLRAVAYELPRERALLLSGEKKAKLVDWWLEFINNKVEAYLAANGYHLDAIPYDYLGTPPRNIELVHQNRVWLGKFLGLLVDLPAEGEPLNEAQAFVAEIKGLVLPFVIDFWRSAKVTLYDVLYASEFDASQLDLDRVVERLTNPRRLLSTNDAIDALTLDALKQRIDVWSKGRTDQALVFSVSCLIKDLEYVDEMLYLEDHQPDPATGLQLGVVPISGLIVGCLYRFENEVVTVLDHWDPGFRKKNAPPTTTLGQVPPPPPLAAATSAARDEQPNTVDDNDNEKNSTSDQTHSDNTNVNVEKENDSTATPEDPTDSSTRIERQPTSEKSTRTLRRVSSVWGRSSLIAAGISVSRISLLPSADREAALSESKTQHPTAHRRTNSATNLRKMMAEARASSSSSSSSSNGSSSTPLRNGRSTAHIAIPTSSLIFFRLFLPSDELLVVVEAEGEVEPGDSEDDDDESPPNLTLSELHNNPAIIQAFALFMGAEQPKLDFWLACRAFPAFNFPEQAAEASRYAVALYSSYLAPTATVQRVFYPLNPTEDINVPDLYGFQTAAEILNLLQPAIETVGRRLADLLTHFGSMFKHTASSLKILIAEAQALKSASSPPLRASSPSPPPSPVMEPVAIEESIPFVTLSPTTESVSSSTVSSSANSSAHSSASSSASIPSLSSSLSSSMSTSSETLSSSPSTFALFGIPPAPPVDQQRYNSVDMAARSYLGIRLSRSEETLPIEPPPAPNEGLTINEPAPCPPTCMCTPVTGPLSFEYLYLLGSDNLGKILMVRRQSCRTGRPQLFAMKVMKKSTVQRDDTIAWVLMEQDIMLKAAKSPNLLKASYAFQTELFLHLVYELCPGGTLARFAKSLPDGLFTESQACFYAVEVLLAIRQLRSLGFLHRDISAKNIFISEQGHVRLANFVRFASPLASASKSAQVSASTSVEQTPSIDLWCLGALIFEFLFGRSPLEDLLDTDAASLVSAAAAASKKTVSADCQDVIVQLLQPGVTLSIASHPWFTAAANQTEAPFLPRVHLSAPNDTRYLRPHALKIPKQFLSSPTLFHPAPSDMFFGFHAQTQHASTKSQNSEEAATTQHLQPDSKQGPPTVSGWLQVYKSWSFLRNPTWKNRWFVLDGVSLRYSRSPLSLSMLSTGLPLTGAVDVTPYDSHYAGLVLPRDTVVETVFHLIFPDRIMHFICPSAEQKEQWVFALMRTLGLMQLTQPQSPDFNALPTRRISNLSKLLRRP